MGPTGTFMVRQAPAFIRRLHADQRHRQRHEGAGDGQDHTGHPVDRIDGDEDQDRQDHRHPALRQEAGVIAVQCLDPLDQRHRQVAGLALHPPGRTQGVQPVEHLAPQPGLDLARGDRAQRLGRPGGAGAQQRRGQQLKPVSNRQLVGPYRP